MHLRTDSFKLKNPDKLKQGKLTSNLRPNIKDKNSKNLYVSPKLYTVNSKLLIVQLKTSLNSRNLLKSNILKEKKLTDIILKILDNITKVLNLL